MVRPRRGEKASLIATLLENARIEFEAQVDPAVVLKPLAAALGLGAALSASSASTSPTAHGEATVASCVVWEDGPDATAQYRHFNIKTVEGVDDFASMAEVVGRRYLRVREEGGETCRGWSSSTAARGR